MVLQQIRQHDVASAEHGPGAAEAPDMVALARGLADEFRAAAAELDRTAAFPAAHYARMRETGYLRAPVPVELGGLGAGLTAMAHAQQALARGCASTALAVNMHEYQVGALADAWRSGGPTEAVLRRIAADGIVLASAAAEAVVAGAWTTPTVAERENGGYRLTGRKTFCSQAPGMDIVRLVAREPESGDLLVCSLTANAEGLRVVETWDTTGMRATASHDLALDGVYVPEAAVAARLSPDQAPLAHPGFATSVVWFQCLTASVYLGVAEEARAEAHRAVAGGRGGNFRDPALTDVLLGELEAEFLTARAVRDHVVSALEADRRDAQAALAQAIVAREVVTAHARAALDKAVALVGGRAFFRASPLERLARDMSAARFHPPAAPVSYQMVGQRTRAALGAAAAP
jgi:alkylation response protein AidB-like acyl-CoA dehydrogenase